MSDSLSYYKENDIVWANKYHWGINTNGELAYAFISGLYSKLPLTKKQIENNLKLFNKKAPYTNFTTLNDVFINAILPD